MGKIASRIVFALLMIAATAALLLLDWRLTALHHYFRGLLAAIVFVLLAILGFGELARLARAGGVQILRISGMLGVLATASLPYWWPALQRNVSTVHFAPVSVVLLLTVALVFAEQMIRFRTTDALRNVAATVLGVVYVGCGAAMALWIRLHHGVATLVLFLAAVKLTDVAAYFIGTAIGRRKLIAWLSPGKTWAGLGGGLAVGTAASVLIVWAFRIPGFALYKAAIFGLLVGAAGQFADLCESLLKRSVHVKDSGALVPEFGGVLDIIDSPLLAAPVAVVLLAILVVGA